MTPAPPDGSSPAIVNATGSNAPSVTVVILLKP
jgi:hypothetical protein